MLENFSTTTGTATVELCNPGYIRVTVNENTTQVLADAVKNLDAAIKASGGKKRPLLSDLRYALPIDPEARRYYSGRVLVEHFLAIAILVDVSPVGKMMANVYLKIAKPQIPTKIFTSEEDAVEWMKIFIE